ncbi:unnamed protein product [Orchesella dallaii]|uniref:Vesicle tethering protein Uso1/P115-like head domain-containing protein n=1 Tax=Orchesella dallaii TaxID=48710 RepID=A0ABP1Q190_9HEXA
MELFKGVWGGQQQTTTNGRSVQDQQTGAETVERLVERLLNSTLLTDRRDACRALKALSKKYRVEVGAQGMDAILTSLESDRIDSELVAYALECLLNVTSPELLEDEDSSLSSMGEQFTEIIAKKPDNLTMLLSFMEEYDFRIRLPVIRLVTNLLTNKPKDVQEILLVSPMGISKIMDLLSDSREVVRNDAILLLVALTKNNANIQKIIAFENGFDRILQIIQEEGYSDGGPVVEDSLQLFLNLLRSNTSNQTFFREGSYIKKIVPFFMLPDSDADLGWPTQKVSNFYHMLQIVRTLTSPSNPSHITLSCQKVIKVCGILECLCQIVMANGIPSETLAEAIATVGEAIRGCLENQEYFGSVVAPSEPPRPVLVILLMGLINERQPLSLRCSVLYCIQCHFYKNEKSQEDVIKSLLPSSGDVVNTLTAGQLLCGGLFSKDISNNWFSSVALSHTIMGNMKQKENLLKVQFSLKANSGPVTLMNYILLSLQQGTKLQMKTAFLQFLSIWLEGCPNAVAQFLGNPTSVPYLITLITSVESDEKEALVRGLASFVMGICLFFNPNTVTAFTKESMIQLINNRIGMETLSDALGQISKSELYIHSLKHPQLGAKHSSDLIFDHYFCIMFKKYESLILQQLNDPGSTHVHVDSSSQDFSKLGHMVNNHQSPTDVISRYKEVIRTQDEAIETLKKEVHSLKSSNSVSNATIEELTSEVLQLKNQLVLANAQRATTELSSEKHSQAHIAEYQTILQRKDQQLHEMGERLRGLESGIQTKNPIQEELISKLEEENKVLVEEVERMKKDQEELLELLAEQDSRILKFKMQLKSVGVQVEDDDDTGEAANVVERNESVDLASNVFNGGEHSDNENYLL